MNKREVQAYPGVYFNKSRADKIFDFKEQSRSSSLSCTNVQNEKQLLGWKENRSLSYSFEHPHNARSWLLFPALLCVLNLLDQLAIDCNIV